MEGHSLVRVGEKIYIFGGFDGYGVTDTVMSYDLRSGQSKVEECKLARARENHTSSVICHSGQ